MKVLVTGAAGFLGRGLIVPFKGECDLRLMDVTEFGESEHECLTGSVADLEVCRKAVEGVDAIVIAHMASRQAGSYQTPEVPFDANVKGTANLFFAAAEQGIKRVVLVSSSGVVGHWQHTEGRFLDRGLPLKSKSIYGLTKVCQETIAEQYARTEGFEVACLRVGYIVDGERREDKYGKPFSERNWQLSDRRDIGSAALAAVRLPDLKWETFYVMSADESMARCDTGYTRQRLGWMPQFKFKDLPPSSVMRDLFGDDYE